MKKGYSADQQHFMCLASRRATPSGCYSSDHESVQGFAEPRGQAAAPAAIGAPTHSKMCQRNGFSIRTDESSAPSDRSSVRTRSQPATEAAATICASQKLS